MKSRQQQVPRPFLPASIRLRTPGNCRLTASNSATRYSHGTGSPATTSFRSGRTRSRSANTDDLLKKYARPIVSATGLCSEPRRSKTSKIKAIPVGATDGADAFEEIRSRSRRCRRCPSGNRRPDMHGGQCREPQSTRRTSSKLRATDHFASVGLLKLRRRAVKSAATYRDAPLQQRARSRRCSPSPRSSRR